MGKNHNYKVLVADDSEACLLMIREIFIIPDKQIELIFAHDGKEAFDKAVENEPDLMLLDVIMPEINGIDLVEMFRKHDKLCKTPIIILSATASLKSAYEAGADDFITKPFNQYELLIKARSALNLLDTIHQLRESKGEIEKQNEDIRHQHNQILEQKKDIIDDITYSKRIQSSILPSVEQMENTLKDYFLFNRPRNIVSGDFYWVGEHHGRKVIAVADCTGHGISGAFMTMAGTVFLNEVFSTHRKMTAGEVLVELRNLVMSLLKQKGEFGEASDGMDISLMIYDQESRTIEFSGANNPLYLVRDGECIIYKGDRMPIGIHLNFEKAFTTTTINVEENDIFYMFSDGFADQFGGPANKKFRYKQFRELILDVYTKPFSQQQKMFEETLLNWMGMCDQVDDIIVLGFQLDV
ncbi:MAG: response regulator [Bacteroidales bacterium]|nr:response regulator [Bacteroidales bacterium]